MHADPLHPGRLTPTVFAECFSHSSRVLWCIAAGVLGDRTHAEDVVQEAAMTALSKLDRFKPGTNFAAWMGTFVRFTALNQRRKQTRRAMRVVDGADPEAQGCEQATGASTALFDAEVTRALQSLGDVARTCLLLKTVIELDYREIAQVLDIPEGTAMSHVSRARSKMRQLLEDARATPTARSKEGA